VQGRDFLVLTSGDEIPVSRSYREAVQDAGLI
jgi:DNA-binding LytR/AlgR family response regulator